ncbi:MAG: hypothetical protein Q7R66_14010 [Undibacterium sp.]|uniref:hypothetical protein n=1 Tax=Undibacterium sp. TaxID=1914977 RepID=UPI0027197245|nr:hypothetical protein [Undibacterium sp.]MDO8653295.1 hypothetical protein [Undibacterium sp.]
MNTENNDDFDFDLWLSAFELIKTCKLSEDEWTDYIDTVTEYEFTKNGCPSCKYECEEDFWELRKYMIGYWDMGEFNETISSGFTEELAIEWFLENYQPKSCYAPYIARCETFYELEQRIKSGDTDFPHDGQTDRFENFGNKYYEALNN